MTKNHDVKVENRILDAAFIVFGEHGFGETTMRQIAAQAEMSAGSLYNYFPDKDSLFEAAAGRGWDRFCEDLETIIAELPGREERVEALLEKGFHNLAASYPLIKGMLFEASKRKILTPKVERVTDSIDRLFADGNPESNHLGSSEKRRALIRIIILGVLSSAAMDASSPQETMGGIKDAVAAFLAAFVVPPRSVTGKGNP